VAREVLHGSLPPSSVIAVLILLAANLRSGAVLRQNGKKQGRRTIPTSGKIGGTRGTRQLPQAKLRGGAGGLFAGGEGGTRDAGIARRAAAMRAQVVQALVDQAETNALIGNICGRDGADE